MKNSKNSTIREFFGRLLLKSTQLFRKMWTRILPRSARVIDGDARLYLFPEKKIIYVEVPKAGCSSIKVALKKNRGDWDGPIDSSFHVWFHYTRVTVEDLENTLKTKYSDWKKFTVVRNPYDRFLSLYNDPRKKLFKKSIDIVLRDFKKYWYRDAHGMSQADLIGRDTSIYDFVGHTESMEDVFDYLSEAFGEKIEFEHRNTARSKKHLSLNYEQKVKLQELYPEDFDLLGYEK